jgi:hypothetical protein
VRLQAKRHNEAAKKTATGVGECRQSVMELGSNPGGDHTWNQCSHQECRRDLTFAMHVQLVRKVQRFWTGRKH